MKIPKVIIKNKNKYIFVKRYSNYVMYKEKKTGIRECFNLHDIFLITNKIKNKI